MFNVKCDFTHGLWMGKLVQPVVDAFDPRLLVAQATVHNIDFNTAKVCTAFLLNGEDEVIDTKISRVQYLHLYLVIAM